MNKDNNDHESRKSGDDRDDDKHRHSKDSTSTDQVDLTAKVVEGPRGAVRPGTVSVGAKFAAIFDERIALKQAQVDQLQRTIAKSGTQKGLTSAVPASRDSRFAFPPPSSPTSADMAAKKAAAGPHQQSQNRTATPHDHDVKVGEGPRAVRPGAVSLGAQSAAMFDERIALKQAQQASLPPSIVVTPDSPTSLTSVVPAGRDNHYTSASAPSYASADMATKKVAGPIARATVPGAVASAQSEGSKDRPQSASTLDERISQKIARNSSSASSSEAWLSSGAMTDDMVTDPSTPDNPLTKKMSGPRALQPGVVTVHAQSAAIFDERIALKRADPPSASTQLLTAADLQTKEKAAARSKGRPLAAVPSAVTDARIARKAARSGDESAVGAQTAHINQPALARKLLGKPTNLIKNGDEAAMASTSGAAASVSVKESSQLKKDDVLAKTTGAAAVTLGAAAGISAATHPSTTPQDSSTASQFEQDVVAKCRAAVASALSLLSPTAGVAGPEDHQEDLQRSRFEMDVLASSARSYGSESNLADSTSPKSKTDNNRDWTEENGDDKDLYPDQANQDVAVLKHQEESVDPSGRCSDDDGHDPLEFGHQLQYDVEDQNLAVAVPVDEDADEVGDGGDVPSAVQYDPHAKPAEFQRRRRRLYIYCGLLGTVIIGVCIAVGVFALGHHGDEVFAEPTPAPTAYRETLGIQEMIQSVVGTDPFVDETSPYSLALNWLLFEDPMMLTPAHQTLYQRYFAAYLYLATSRDQAWQSCGRPFGNDTASCARATFTFSDKLNRSDFAANTQPTLSLRWMSDGSECYWDGVTCDSQHQIRSIHLLGLNMTGTFPEGLRFMPYLQHFFTFYGNLRGPIPSEIASMKNLNELGLRTHQLSGQLPKELWSMPSLHVLNLGENRFSGTFPTEMASMVDLKRSIIHNNAFSSGTIPTEIGLLKSVFFIYWDANRLGGTIPTEIGHLTALYRLGLSENELSGTIPTELGRIQFQSSWFDLKKNRLRGPIPTEIFSLPLLERIEFQDNRLTGALSTWIGNMRLLHEINVQNNDLTGTIPTELGNPLFKEVIRGVVLNGNKFTGTMPDSVCALRSSFFTELVADCLPDHVTGLAQIECPASCCSLCCDSSGTTCSASSGS